jgi:hypothetical protein
LTGYITLVAVEGIVWIGASRSVGLQSWMIFGIVLMVILSKFPAIFVIPVAKYQKAVYNLQVSVGMRFRMVFETEESSVRR